MFLPVGSSMFPLDSKLDSHLGHLGLLWARLHCGTVACTVCLSVCAVIKSPQHTLPFSQCAAIDSSPCSPAHIYGKGCRDRDRIVLVIHVTANL